MEALEDLRGSYPPFSVGHDGHDFQEPQAKRSHWTWTVCRGPSSQAMATSPGWPTISERNPWMEQLTKTATKMACQAFLFAQSNYWSFISQETQNCVCLPQPKEKERSSDTSPRRRRPRPDRPWEAAWAKLASTRRAPTALVTRWCPRVCSWQLMKLNWAQSQWKVATVHRHPPGKWKVAMKKPL